MVVRYYQQKAPIIYQLKWAKLRKIGRNRNHTLKLLTTAAVLHSYFIAGSLSHWMAGPRSLGKIFCVCQWRHFTAWASLWHPVTTLLILHLSCVYLESAMSANLEAQEAIIFSCVRHPPPPLIQFKQSSTSSAPSIARSNWNKFSKVSQPLTELPS